MTQECFSIYKSYFACKLNDLGDKLAIAQMYGTKKEECYKHDLIISTFLFEAIRCLCFYTQAEQEEDATLTTGDKLGCATHDEIMTIINKLKSILDSCDC